MLGPDDHFRDDQDPPPTIVGAWFADYPHAESFLTPEVIWGLCRWRHERYERLIERARGLADRVERMKLYREADRMLVEEAVLMPGVYGRWHELLKPWVVWADQLKDVIIMPH